MRLLLLFCFLLTGIGSAVAQQQAVITGDEMICSNGTGTAMVQGIVPYDAYQWQVKAYGEASFVNIAGATTSTFTYDAVTYSVTYIRCQVTQNGSTFFSNELFIDSMVSLPIFYSSETAGNVTINPSNGGYLLCPGGSITNMVSGGFNSIQWYQNDIAIPGATSATYVVTQPGVYYASAINTDCPGPPENTLPQEVALNPNCAPVDPIAPVIEGDLLLCPGADGTAEVINETEYDTYQWQFKFSWETEYLDIEGATEDTFTYGQYDYSVTDIRVKVTLDGTTYYSNALAIDGIVFAGLIVEHDYDEDEVGIDQDGNFLICEGDEITNTVGLPYTIVQWYKDGQAIAGATNPVFVITEPGEYYVVASPAACPGYTQTLIPFTVAVDPDCATNGIDGPDALNAFTLYPNPASTMLNLSLPQNTALQSYTIVDVTGKTLMSGTLTGTAPAINIEALATGSYIIKATGNNIQATKMFVKQ